MRSARDSLLPVVLSTQTLLPGLLWQSLSQQQGLSQAAVIALTAPPPISPYSSLVVVRQQRHQHWLLHPGPGRQSLLTTSKLETTWMSGMEFSMKFFH